MKKKICIVNCYFGKLPKIFELWVESCKYNPKIDFLIITDQEINIGIENIKIINMKFEDFVKFISDKLNVRLNIKKPHKICDFKPMYGIILDEYLKDYMFWGHCDLDMIFGDLEKFITNEILNKYDKIYSLGHLSLYRNESSVNKRVFIENSEVNIKRILQDERTLGFDEIRGIYSIYKKNGYSIYDRFEFADITHRYERFKLSCSYKKMKNYSEQIFYWKEGRVYRAFIDNNIVKKEEFVYIHFQKRNLNIINSISENKRYFLITNQGLILLHDTVEIDRELIKKYNKYKGEVYEYLEETFFKIGIIKKAVQDKLRKIIWI